MKQEIRERIEKIRKGEVPEGYRKTKVGIIPEDWEVKKLGEKTTKIGSGITPTGGEKVYKSEGRPFLRSQNVGWGNLLLEDIAFIDDEIHNTFKSTEIIKNDVFLNITGASIGRSAIADERVEMGNVNQHVCIIRTIENELKPKFLNYCLLSKNGQKQIDSYQAGGNRQGLNFEQIKSFQIPLPLIPEQEKIAEILSTWDKAIELKEKLIEEKKKLRSAIVNDLLFGLKRFDEFIKSHKYKHTKYIRIPEDWEYIKIGEIATEVSEKNGNHNELPVLSCTKYEGLVDSLSYFKRQVFSEDTSTYKQVKKNYFVYATNHIDEGSIGYQNLFENSLVSPMYTVFKTKSSVNNLFLFNLLKTGLYIFIYQANMSASVDRRGSLRWNEFSKIHIPLPIIAEQNKIVEFILSVDTEINLLNKELNQLQEQKRCLMQLLLTGIVRVGVD